MWRNIKVVFAVSIVSLSLALTISSSVAQDTTRDDLGTRTTTMRDDDDNDGFDLGWLGLAGLGGLVGLMPKDRNDRNDRRDHDLKR